MPDHRQMLENKAFHARARIPPLATIQSLA
jgi:hypothetical protein